MKIIQIIASIFDENSGPSYSVKRLCEELEVSNKVELLTFSKEAYSMIKSNQKLKITEYHKQFPLSYRSKKLGSSKKLRKYLQVKIKDKSINIIHSHAMWHIIATYPGNLLKYNDYKIVTSPRGTLSRIALDDKKFIKVIFWYLFLYLPINKTHCFHATSYQEYLDIRNKGFKQPIAIIPNGIDIPKIIKKKCTMNKRYITFIGRIDKIKGLENLLNAWKQVHKKFDNWHLKIIGTDMSYNKKSNYLYKLKRLSIKLNLINIDFIDPLYGEEKLQELADSDIMVLPSLSENFGMTVAESLSVGTPVITTNQTPWHEIVEKKSGWCIDVGVKPMVECLENVLLLDSDKLENMGKNGIEWMKNDYSWHSVAKKFLLTYKWLLNPTKNHQWIITK